MKRNTVILPFVLPRLTDKAAAQFIELLHELIAGIEHHYAKQVQRYHKRQREIRFDRQPPASHLTDTPF
jgi:hypothetical protein